MGKARFSDDFKRDAVHQIIKCGYSVSEVSKRLGVSTHSLYAWVKKFSNASGSDPSTEQSLIHSDQGSQSTSKDWASFLRHHHLEHSMSRRGNCHDNAVAESFFNLLKRERIRRRTYRSREEARRDVFNYIEMFYNPKRKQARNGMLSPIDFERQQKLKT